MISNIKDSHNIGKISAGITESPSEFLININ